jgi:hypothetical protein
MYSVDGEIAFALGNGGSLSVLSVNCNLSCPGDELPFPGNVLRGLDHKPPPGGFEAGSELLLAGIERFRINQDRRRSLELAGF